MTLAGESIADMVLLAREQVGESKDSAAVLAAAAFEATMRRIAKELAGVNDRPNLTAVILGPLPPTERSELAFMRSASSSTTTEPSSPQPTSPRPPTSGTLRPEW